MASTSKQKTTMAKLNRERKLRERRELKQAKKDARRREATASPIHLQDATATESRDDAQPGDAAAGAL
jgi:hypothetical protein